MTPDVKREVIRKLLHMGMGLFALCLRWLAPWQAVLCALAALLHNLYLFPHYGMKRLERPEEKARGYSGMIGYPAVVLVLLVMSWFWGIGAGEGNSYYLFRREPGGCDLWFHQTLVLAAASWAFLAAGDALGALCGIFIGGPKLPWNPKKTWSGVAGFIVFGTSAAYGVSLVVGQSQWGGGCVRFLGFLPSDHPLLLLITGVVAATVESLPDQIDDNLTVPLGAWSVMALGMVGNPWWFDVHHPATVIPWSATALTGLLIVNAALAGVAYWRGWVDRWGLLLGLVFGAVVALGLGVPGYCLLLLFYLVANGSTHYGKHVKEQRGIAEPHDGQRRAGSVFSKGFSPAIFALLSFPAFAASVATYAADTAASEFGKTSKGRAVSLRALKVVPAGSVGAISLKGTLAGLSVLGLFLFVWGFGFWYCNAMFSWEMPKLTEFTLLGVAMSTVFCFFFESWFNEWNASRRYFSKEVIHVMLGFLAGMLTYAPEVVRAVFLAAKGALP